MRTENANGRHTNRVPIAPIAGQPPPRSLCAPDFVFLTEVLKFNGLNLEQPAKCDSDSRFYPIARFWLAGQRDTLKNQAEPNFGTPTIAWPHHL